MTEVDPGRSGWLSGGLSRAFPMTTISAALPANLVGFDLIVNASSVGMDGSDAMPIDAGLLATVRPNTLVADVVTKPPLTPFLRRARELGCWIQEGPDMAAGQLELLGRFMSVLP